MKNTLKKLLCVILTLCILPCAGYAYAESNGAVLSYSFEDGDNAPALFGNARLVYDEDKGGNVLSLDGTDGTYAEIPQGFFDNRNVMTIAFDVLENGNNGNYFTFSFGLNNEVYDFFRIRGNEIRNGITRWSYQNEHETRTEMDNVGTWRNIAIVFNGTQMLMYVDGALAAENTDTTINVSDMGTGLLSYFGKSFYEGDMYFNGCFDNFEVYNRVLSAGEISRKAAANIPYSKVLRYSFEFGTTMPTFYGNATTVYDNDRGGAYLSLNGADGTYAEIPQGFFDGRDVMTIAFDIKALSNGGNYFTFAFGRDNTKYDFFRIRGSEIRNAITVNTYYSEQEVKTSADSTDGWMSIAIVFDGVSQKLYVNGTLAAENQNTGLRVSDLGSNLLSYLGKSFYDGDGYFNGYFDNFEVYDCVLAESVIREKALLHLPLLVGASVGNAVNNLDNISGTDAHTTVKTAISRESGEITSYIQRRQNIKAVPVSFYTLNPDCTVYVDGNVFVTGGLLDMTYDRAVKITCDGKEENYTLKAAAIANNPVLPGMYADPDIDILDGKFWIYPTTDGTPGWGGTEFHAFSSPDMVHWTDEGVILDNKNKSPSLNAKGVQIASSAWSDGNAWAPSIEEKNGKYYFYYCGRILDSLTSQYGEGMAIGVAWADSPAGPYTAASAPILYPKMLSDANIGFSGQVIDPAIYTEGSSSYILFGNGMAAMADLNSDMTSVNTSSLRIINNLTDFRESIAVFKRDGYYYFTWSCDDTGSENYHINYATSSSLKGSVTNRGTLLQKDVNSGILATGHQSVIYLPDCDRCFIAYHRFYTPLSVGGNVGHRRETCIEEITFQKKTFSADLMNAVTPSMAGVLPVDVNGNNITETITYATCETDGVITANGLTLTAQDAPEIKAAGHSYVKTVVEPTCTEDGYDLYRCSACGTQFANNYVPKTGHNLTVARAGTSDFFISCRNCGVSDNYSFEDYLNLRENDSGYTEILDTVPDGIINAKDYARLISLAE